MSNTRAIVDYSLEDNGSAARDALYSEIHDRVMSHIEAKKMELAGGMLTKEEKSCSMSADDKDYDDSDDKKKKLKKAKKKLKKAKKKMKKLKESLKLVNESGEVDEDGEWNQEDSEEDESSEEE